MNAIEQMMQAFGATSAQSMAAMFGTSAAAESNAVEFANQFTAALQNNEMAVFGADSPWRLSQNPTLEAYSATGVDALSDIAGLAAQFNGELQGAIVAPTATTAETDLKSYAASDAVPSAYAFGGEQADTEFQPYAEGIPGLQLVQLSGLDLTSLIESGHLQPLNLEGTSQLPASNDMFLFAANGGNLTDGQPVRLLPIAQLEALTSSEFAATGTPPHGPMAGAAEAALAHPGGKPAFNGPTPSVAEGAAQQAATAAVTASPSNATPDLVAATPQAASADSVTTQVANETLSPSLNKPAADPLVQKAAEQTIQAKAEDKAAEGHMVQQNQKAAAAQTARAGRQQALAQAAQGPQNENQTMQAATQTSAAAAPTKPVSVNKEVSSTKDPASSPKTAHSTAETGPAVPRQDQQTAPARVSTPITWTPERLAGLPDSAAPGEAVAGGLGGLRGEPSFMGSMGLMGGKPSPSLGGQIAQQENLQVTKAVKNGTSEFNMRLNPTELGQVRIKMSFNDAGRVSAQLFVERPETLELLQREVRGMERAVEAGGHKMEQGGISFNLDADDGQSAGKAFADAVQQDRLKERAEEGSKGNEAGTEDDFEEPNDLTDLAALEEILSRVSPDTGLDVRV